MVVAFCLISRRRGFVPALMCRVLFLYCCAAARSLRPPPPPLPVLPRVHLSSPIFTDLISDHCHHCLCVTEHSRLITNTIDRSISLPSTVIVLAALLRAAEMGITLVPLPGICLTCSLPWHSLFAKKISQSDNKLTQETRSRAMPRDMSRDMNK